MVFSVARATKSASASWPTEPFISNASALCSATSVPPLSAKPTSAAASAGASLMPSPAIATTLPSAISCRTASALSRGDIAPCAAAKPSSVAICATAAGRSPLIIRTSMPTACKRATAAALSGRRVSANATAPSALPSAETAATLAICQMPSRFSGSLKPQNSDLPTRTLPIPATSASKPAPASL